MSYFFYNFLPFILGKFFYIFACLQQHHTSHYPGFFFYYVLICLADLTLFYLVLTNGKTSSFFFPSLLSSNRCSEVLVQLAWAVIAQNYRQWGFNESHLLLIFLEAGKSVSFRGTTRTHVWCRPHLPDHHWGLLTELPLRARWCLSSLCPFDLVTVLLL